MANRTREQREQDAKDVAKAMNEALIKKYGGYDSRTTADQRRQDAAEVAREMNAAIKRKKARNTPTTMKNRKVAQHWK